jgi:hypothetical protein
MTIASDHGHGYHTALAIVVDRATRWGENAEENLVRRVDADADEGEVLALAEASNVDPEDVRDIRDLWAAIKIITGSI